MSDTTQAASLAVKATGVSKKYGKKDTAVVALKDVSVSFHSGEFAAIMGPSGSGKSTLMHVCAALDEFDSGSISVGGIELSELSEKKTTRLRRDEIGFVFQSFNLIPTLSAQENMTLPLDLAGKKRDKEWFDKIVDVLNLKDRLKHRPSELSGGQQQRVAIGRALVSRPKIIFADEPTGNLDSKSGVEVLTLLKQAVDQFGQTVVMVTHDAHAASYASRVLFLSDGRIVGEMTNPTTEAILDQLKKVGE